MNRTAPRWRPIAISAAAATGVAVLGAAMTELGPWYRALTKPSWQPPDWLFAPAWTTIFALCALSAATAWMAAPTRATREWVIALFGLNALLNVAWSAIFFRLHRPDWALLEVVLLWLSIAMLIVLLARISRHASLLLVPYLAWVSFAGVLNWAVVQLN
jgi:tryptophan-rich sensory protein